MKLNQSQILIASALLGVGVIWIISRGGLRGAAASVVGAAGDVASGGVVGIGSLVGIPETDMAQCQKDLADGAYIAASFSCPAGTYIPRTWGAIYDGATDAVKGTGKVFGIPETNQSQCERDMAAGDWWKASFSCPAGTFIKNSLGSMSDAVFGSTVISTTQQQDAAVFDDYTMVAP